MPQKAQLDLYLKLRTRLLARDIPTGPLPSSRLLAEENGLSAGAAVGVLNALLTDGYLERQGRHFNPRRWTPEGIIECTYRLEIFSEICASRLANEEGERHSWLRKMDKRITRLDVRSEAFYMAMMSYLVVLLGAGDRPAIGDVAHRLLPQAYFRIAWNLLLDADHKFMFIEEGRSFVSLMESGDAEAAKKSLVGLWERTRARIKGALAGNPILFFRMEDIVRRNTMREPDIRGRVLPLSYPGFPPYLPPIETHSVMGVVLPSAPVQ